MALIIGLLLLFIIFFVIRFTTRENSHIAKHKQMQEAKSKAFKKGIEINRQPLTEITKLYTVRIDN
jgi:hypothetical protein